MVSSPEVDLGEREESQWVAYLERDPHIRSITVHTRKQQIPPDEAYTYAGFLYPEMEEIMGVRSRLAALLDQHDQPGIEKLLLRIREHSANETNLDDLARIHDAYEDFLLRDPVIEDDFENRHDEPGGRRQWEATKYAEIKQEQGQAAARELSQFLGSNRLNRNRLAGILMMLDELERMAQSTGHIAVATTLRQYRLSGRDLLGGSHPYQEKTLPEKHAVLQAFDEIIIKTLGLLTTEAITSAELEITSSEAA